MNSQTHHIHKLTRLATSLDAKGLHAEADRLDRIILSARQHHAQSWNPIRVWKNTRNWWTQMTNGDNPELLLNNMQNALDRLHQDASKQTLLAGLDPTVRPTALALVAKIEREFHAYADNFTSGRTPTASAPDRIASLAMGVARDCNDIIGLLGPLTNEEMFKGGTAVYNQLRADLTTLSNLLTEQITPGQAGAQAGTVGQPSSSVVPGSESQPQSPQSGTGGQSSSTGQGGAYSSPDETYNDTQYLQQERVPGSPEWNNEIQNYLNWGIRNGGLTALTEKMQQDAHTPQFQYAVENAWKTKGLPSAGNQTQGANGAASASAIGSPQTQTAY